MAQHQACNLRPFSAQSSLPCALSLLSLVIQAPSAHELHHYGPTPQRYSIHFCCLSPAVSPAEDFPAAALVIVGLTIRPSCCCCPASATSLLLPLFLLPAHERRGRVLRVDLEQVIGCERGQLLKVQAARPYKLNDVPENAEGSQFTAERAWLRFKELSRELSTVHFVRPRSTRDLAILGCESVWVPDVREPAHRPRTLPPEADPDTSPE